MVSTPDIKIIEPVGKILSQSGKAFLRLLNAKLNFLDIDRDYYALLLIEQGDGAITQNELARQLETDKVSIVRIIDYLAEKGYVERVRSSSDGRKQCLTLTDKAKKAIPSIKKSFREVTETALQGLSENRKSEFYLALETIKHNLINANTAGI